MIISTLDFCGVPAPQFSRKTQGKHATRIACAYRSRTSRRAELRIVPANLYEYERRAIPGSGGSAHAFMGRGPHQRQSGPSAHRVLEGAVTQTQTAVGAVGGWTWPLLAICCPPLPLFSPIPPVTHLVGGPLDTFYHSPRAVASVPRAVEGVPRAVQSAPWAVEGWGPGQWEVSVGL